MEIFTNRFVEFLRFEKINQTELANNIGISKQCISDYKVGKSYPTIQTLALLCRELNTSSDYLLGLEDDFGQRANVANVAPMGESLSAEERALLADFRKLSPYLQGIAANTVRGLTGTRVDDLHKKA